MSTLPLTPNGKVNRRALPAPDLRDTQAEYVAPTNQAERVLAGIWEDVLHIAPISVEANFFELGGHSLLATQVVSRIQKSMGVALPLRSLFEHPTISRLAKETSMAEQLDTRVRRRSSAPTLRAVEGAGPFPLSFAQQRLWVLDRLEPHSAAYNIPISIRFTGALNVEALENALNTVVERHAVLRTEFRTVEGEPAQQILEGVRIPLRVVNLKNLPAHEREKRALEVATEEAGTPFKLNKGPLVRAALIELGEADHVFVSSVHHIVFDGWSIGIFLNEIAACYTAEVLQQSPKLPEISLQYGDFAAWQREALQGGELQRQLGYWSETLAGASNSVDLPTDRPRPPVQTFRGESQTALISQSVLESLQAISQRENVTLFMTLLAAFDILLQRYSAQDDVVVGTPIAGRNHEEVEQLIGLFVNTLVLRNDLSGDPTFLQLLKRVQKIALDAYANQDVPFEKLVEELKPERDLSRNPLFQIMFSLQNVPREEWSMPGLTPGPFQVSSGTEKFDLSISLVPKPNGLKVTFGYNTDLYDSATIERMMGHFERLLEGIAAAPAAPISQLALLDETEKKQILLQFNATKTEYPRSASLPSLFVQQVERTPHASAVFFENQQLTYAELNSRANQLAHYLIKQGVGPEVLVGICVERSLEILVSTLAVLKAGAAYVPLDPAYPKDRIGFILENAQAPVLISQDALLENLPEYSAKLVLVDRDAALIAVESVNNPNVPVKADNLAYVLYTSGSTGKPKGVQIEHRNLVNFLTGMQKEPGFTAHDTLIAVTTLSFDIAGLELYLPLVTGGKLVIASREQAADGPQLLGLLNNSQATIMQATPATWRMLMEAGWKGDSRLKILCGGEAMPADLADQLLPRCSELWNMYGPTETTIWSSVYRVQQKLTSTAPIGRPIVNTTMYVLDALKRPTPLGVAGELYIGGDGVARGYYNRPDLTAEKFMADPFRPGERIYRTGDLAKFLPDGNIQFLGRADFQVKVRGFRIELEEIEAALAQHPAIQQCVVSVREDRPGDKRLVGYVVTKTADLPSTADLRTHLKQSLPEYMVPSIFVQLESLPLTPNGKINRRALPAPDWSQRDSGEVVGARDQLELMLLNIWQKVLGIPEIGITDNFFDLGGHSLLAARLLSEVEKVVGRQIPLAALFRGATVESLAQLIREDAAANPDPVVMSIQDGAGKLPFFGVASPGVETLGYALLARSMGKDQPVYKLQGHDPVVEGRPFTDEELRALSNEYIAAMRAVQPEGPYCLGGMCEGVQIAERMVVDLEAAGHEVGFFAIFDTWVLQNTQIRWLWRISYYQQRLRSLRRMSLSKRLQGYRKALRNNVLRAVKSEKVPVRTDWVQTYWPENHQATPFQAPVILFKRPKQPFYYINDPELGWGTRSKSGVEVHEVDFHHLEMLREPWVQVLGEKLAQGISRVANRNGGRREHAASVAESEVRSR